MSAASDYLENKLIDHSLGTAAFTAPTTVYLALFNNTSGNASTNLEAGTLTDEVSTAGTAYARQAVAFDASVDGSTGNTSTVTFPTATASFGSVTHVAVMDSNTAGSGNVLYHGAVTTAKTIDSGDTFQVSGGNLTISLD